MLSMRSALLGTSGILGLMVPIMAHAQDTASPPAAVAADTAGGDIIVTAQRRSEPLSRTPVAVTAISAAALEARGATRLEDVSASTPSLTVSPTTASPNAIQITLRGALQQSGGSITAESPVALYIDDVIQPRLQAGNFELADIERVEVLRGPQGTLYGRNSMTGAIKLITRQPNGDTWLNTDVSYASFEETKAKGSLGLPVGDHLAIAASGFYDNRNKGFQYNEVLKQRVGVFTRYGGRLSLGLINIPNFEAVLTGRALVGLSDGQYFMPVGPTGQNLASDFYNTRSPRLGYGDNWQQTLSLNLSYDLGAVKLRSISAYQHMRDRWAIDFSGGYDLPNGTTIPAFFRSTTSNQKQYSQELQALGKSFDDRLNWIVGAFYFRETGSQVYLRDELNLFASISAPGTYWIKSDSVAFYAQGDYKIVPDLTVSVGLRYTDDKKVFDGLAPLTAGLNAPLFPSHYTTGSKVWTPRFNVSYQATPNVLFYGTVSRGYKAGSFNTLLVADPKFGAPYKPEFNWSYEIGTKIHTADNSAYVNLAAYHEIFSDLQETASAGGVSFGVINAAKARVQGIEWEIGVRPLPGLNLYTSGAYTDNKYLELDPTTAPAQAGAKTLPMISRWQVQVGGTYKLDLANAGSVTFAADYDYRSPYFVQVSLDPISRIDSTNRFNGSITYQAPGGHLEVYAQGTNLTKSRDWANSLNFFKGFFGDRYPAQPRILRVGFRYKY